MRTLEEQFGAALTEPERNCRRYHASTAPLPELTQRLSPSYIAAAQGIMAGRSAPSYEQLAARVDRFIEQSMARGLIRAAQASVPIPDAIQQRIVTLDDAVERLRDRIDASDASSEGPTENAEELFKQIASIEEEIAMLRKEWRRRRVHA